MSDCEPEDRLFHRVLKKSRKKISHGKGVYLFDTDGRRYPDACAAVHVVNNGHDLG